MRAASRGHWRESTRRPDSDSGRTSFTRRRSRRARAGSRRAAPAPSYARPGPRSAARPRPSVNEPRDRCTSTPSPRPHGPTAFHTGAAARAGMAPARASARPAAPERVSALTCGQRSRSRVGQPPCRMPRDSAPWAAGQKALREILMSLHSILSVGFAALATSNARPPAFSSVYFWPGARFCPVERMSLFFSPLTVISPSAM